MWHGNLPAMSRELDGNAGCYLVLRGMIGYGEIP
jgi:hypothetical protein